MACNLARLSPAYLGGEGHQLQPLAERRRAVRGREDADAHDGRQRVEHGLVLKHALPEWPTLSISQSYDAADCIKLA